MLSPPTPILPSPACHGSCPAGALQKAPKRAALKEAHKEALALTKASRRLVHMGYMRPWGTAAVWPNLCCMCAPVETTCCAPNYACRSPQPPVLILLCPLLAARQLHSVLAFCRC